MWTSMRKREIRKHSTEAAIRTTTTSDDYSDSARQSFESLNQDLIFGDVTNSDDDNGKSNISLQSNSSAGSNSSSRNSVNINSNIHHRQSQQLHNFPHQNQQYQLNGNDSNDSLVINNENMGFGGTLRASSDNVVDNVNYSKCSYDYNDHSDKNSSKDNNNNANTMNLTYDYKNNDDQNSHNTSTSADYNATSTNINSTGTTELPFFSNPFGRKSNTRRSSKTKRINNNMSSNSHEYAPEKRLSDPSDYNNTSEGTRGLSLDANSNFNVNNKLAPGNINNNNNDNNNDNNN
eukprot:Awhi_evm1s3120